jgi:hypothetical protein
MVIFSKEKEKKKEKEVKTTFALTPIITDRSLASPVVL